MGGVVGVVRCCDSDVSSAADAMAGANETEQEQDAGVVADAGGSAVRVVVASVWSGLCCNGFLRGGMGNVGSSSSMRCSCMSVGSWLQHACCSGQQVAGFCVSVFLLLQVPRLTHTSQRRSRWMQVGCWSV